MFSNHIFTFATSSLKQPADGETPPTGIWQNFEHGKIQKFGFCLKEI